MSRDERVPLARVEIQEALNHLEQPRACVQFVGDRGQGKTTHLLALASRFPGSAYVHIPEHERCRIPKLGDPLLIDEAQRLTIYQRWQVLRSSRRLILGTHEDFARVLSHARRPVLTLAADRLTDAGRLCKIFNARIEAARRATGPVPTITLGTATALHARFGSDIRSIEHALYEIFQQLRDVQDV